MIYPYKCPDCAHYLEEWRPLANCADVALCTECGQVMCRVYTPNPGRVDLIKNRPPPGCVLLGNEKPNLKPAVRDYGGDVEGGLRAEVNSGRYPELASLGA